MNNLSSHNGNFARYQMRPSEFEAWRGVWDAKMTGASYSVNAAAWRQFGKAGALRGRRQAVFIELVSSNWRHPLRIWLTMASTAAS